MCVAWRNNYLNNLNASAQSDEKALSQAPRGSALFSVVSLPLS